MSVPGERWGRVEGVGDCVKGGRYRVGARFRRSVLLLGSGGRACFVVNREIGNGPLNVVTADPGAWVRGAEGEEECVEGCGVAGAARWDSTMPRLGAARVEAARKSLAEGLWGAAPRESLASVFAGGAGEGWQRNRDAYFRTALAKGAAGDLAGMAGMVKGCGQGLTPSGDDFLSGVMLGLRLQGRGGVRTILRWGLGGNEVSNAFLRMAAGGHVNEAVKAWLERPGEAGRLERAVAFGHTSGADLLCGMWWALGGGAAP